MRGHTQRDLGGEGWGAGPERERRCSANAYGRGKDYVLGNRISDQERPGLDGRAIKRMDDEALLGGMLERGGRLAALGCRSQVMLGVGKRMQLRRAAGKGQRERK